MLNLSSFVKNRVNKVKIDKIINVLGFEISEINRPIDINDKA